MASGDTKTEAMLNVLGNGGSGDEFRGCCNTKTQSYILDAIDRINAIQPGGTSDFNDLSNRPQLNGTAMTGNTNITNFTGTDGTNAGAQGLVPAPAAADADKFLKSDGTWATAGGGGGPTVVQTTGTSTTDVMSQDAVSGLLFADKTSREKIRIGNGATANSTYVVSIGAYTQANNAQTTAVGSMAMATGNFAVAIGGSAYATHASSTALGYYTHAYNTEATAIGDNATASGLGSVAIGGYSVSPETGSVALGYMSGSNITDHGMVDVGAVNTSYGYDNTNYRLITGVHDAQGDHDAVTLGQLNALVTQLQNLGLNVSLQGAANNANQNSGSSEDPGMVEPDPGVIAPTVTCPFCGQQTSADSTICQFCGNDISGGAMPDPGEEPGPEIPPEEPTEEPVEG